MSKLRLSFTTVKAVFRHRIAWLCTIVLLAGLSITLAAKYRSFEKTALAKTDAKAQQGCCSTVPATLRRMIGTYYNTEDGFQSSLVLNNKGPNVIAVTPILHSKNGQTFNAPQVFVNGESSLEVDLNALANSAGANFKSGSFEFTYQGRMMEMGGGLRIVNTAKSLIFDEQLLEPGMKFSSPNLEAVYAIPSDKSDASVIVTNTTAQPLSLNGSATFVGANGQHPINGTLGAYETSVVNLPNGLVKQSTAGAVSITHNGTKGALMAIIHVWDKNKGFSASVNFADPAQGKTTQLHGAGLRLGSVSGSTLKPVIAVRNIGNVATTVTSRIPYTKQDGSSSTIALPQTSLAAGETKLINTTHPGLGQADIATAGIEIEYIGAPGSVIAAAHSVSANGNQVFTVPMKDPKGGMSSTGGYPWFITDTSSTVVFIKNTTNEAQQFHLGLVYQGGKWGSNLKTLAPGQTYLLDVKKVRDTQEKGSEGNTIPAHVTSGHIAWSVRGKTNKVLIGRAQTVDFTNALASTYECQCQCPSSFSFSYLSPGSVGGLVGDNTTFSAYQIETNCYGNPLPPYQLGFGVNFSSANTSVATVNSSGLGTAVGVGSTLINANWNANVWTLLPNESGSGEPGECVESIVPADCSASCTVYDITISGPVSCKDGDTANFSVSVPPEDPPVSIQWSFTAPSGAGNNPQVTFGSPTAASTTASCKWFALPNSECGASFDSQYTIRCLVNLSGGRQVTRETTLTVNAFWNPAGSVAPPTIMHGPTYGFNTQTNLWVVTGAGMLSRVVSSAVIYVPSTSQFYNKTVTHENRHVHQWTSGMLSDLFTIQSLMSQLSPLTDATEQGLITKINNASIAWFNSQAAIYQSRLADAERDAFAQSDPIAPMYRYTKTCNGY